MPHLAMTSANTIGRWVPDAVYSFSDSWNQAQALAQKCGALYGECDVHRFPDGETLVTVAPGASLAGRVVALYRSLNDPNSKLIELLLAADALRALGAEKLILIAPYMPYMRQDRAFKPGQAVSQMTVGNLLADKFDGLVTVQPHLHRTKSLSAVFGGKPALNLGAGRAIAAHMQGMSDPLSVVVGPDEESEPLIRDVIDVLGTSWFIARKVRRGDTEVEFDQLNGREIANHPITIVDDIVSSGGTVATLAKALKKAGAGDITVYAVHALFDQRAANLMARAGVSKMRSLSTVSHTTNAVSVVDLICAGLGVKHDG
ncbi:MAG: ribose-phosphate diphosphokinase [Rhodospirillaceae bacterium]